jgi:hypothetical protein
MTSKHTKAGRHARRRAHHEGIAAEAWGAYQGRRLLAWLRSPRGKAWTAREGTFVAREVGATQVRLVAPPSGGLSAWEIVS